MYYDFPLFMRSMQGRKSHYNSAQDLLAGAGLFCTFEKLKSARNYLLDLTILISLIIKCYRVILFK